MTSTPFPPPELLRRFACGDLPDDEAERVAESISPDSEEALRRLSSQATLPRILSTVSNANPSPNPAVDRLIRSLNEAAAGGDPTGSYVAAGASVGEYRIVRELARGGMGLVYEADHVRMGRRAVKVLLPKYAQDPVFRQRFEREIRVAAKLNSPHVVTTHHAGECDGQLFLAMEYLDGPSLETWLETRPVPVTAREVLSVACQLLAGLTDLHKSGIIHRDIKPQNAMLDPRTPGRVKLIDIGLARGTADGDSITDPNNLVGTPAYMAPEQVAGKRPDPKWDVFSVGVVLYRMIDGESPFRRGSPLETIAAVSHYEPPPLDNVPAAVNDFIFRLLAKNPDGRPDAAAALAKAEALARALATSPVEQRPRRIRRWVVAGCAAVLVLAGIVFVIRDKEGNILFGLEAASDGSKRQVKMEGPNGSVEVSVSTVGGRPVAPAPRAVMPPTAEPRVKVTHGAVLYLLATTDAKPLGQDTLQAGALVVLLEDPPDQDRCRIRLESGEPVWLLRSCLDLK